MVFLEDSFRLAGQEKIDELLRPFLVLLNEIIPASEAPMRCTSSVFNFTVLRFYADIHDLGVPDGHFYPGLEQVSQSPDVLRVALLHVYRGDRICHRPDRARYDQSLLCCLVHDVWRRGNKQIALFREEYLAEQCADAGIGRIDPCICFLLEYIDDLFDGFFETRTAEEHQIPGRKGVDQHTCKPAPLRQ